MQVEQEEEVDGGQDPAHKQLLRPARDPIQNKRDLKTLIQGKDQHKSGHIEIRIHRDLDTWRSGYIEIWIHRDQDT